MTLKRTQIGVMAVVGVAVAVLLLSSQAQFLTGGALINAGYRMQDHLDSFDFTHQHDITPEQVWKEFESQNSLASSVRSTFPRTARHPLVAMLVCMDARIDTAELAGDTRRNYYVVRTAGSVMSPKEEEMLELAVANGVKLIVLTRHTDCAAEKAAANPAMRAKYPALVEAVEERKARVDEFLKRPVIAERIANGTLLVKQLVIDTATEHLDEGLAPPPAHAESSAAATH